MAQSAEPPENLGSWNLADRIAEGNWARVYRARPSRSPAHAPAAYAVKVVRPDRQDDPRAAALLAREALAGRSVSHPHLIAILETHIATPPAYLVMPWLEGGTLESRLKCGECLDSPMALWIARQVAEALSALHSAGWTHGDVKPGNIFLSPEGHATLLDLGFARRRGEADSIGDRWLMGTFNYLAPEYFTTTLQPDIRSDIYSLGVVLFEMLAGRVPFPCHDPDELATEHKQATVPDLRCLAPHVPPPVVQLIRRMLSKDPLRRPQTPRELVERLIELEIATFSERAVA
jgi:eukaryotic-like serine/threonine-protein kinase